MYILWRLDDTELPRNYDWQMIVNWQIQCVTEEGYLRIDRRNKTGKGEGEATRYSNEYKVP